MTTIQTCSSVSTHPVHGCFASGKSSHFAALSCAGTHSSHMCIEIKGCSVKNGKFWGKSQSITHSSQICNHIYVQSNQPKINSRISKNLISTRTNKFRTMFLFNKDLLLLFKQSTLFSLEIVRIKICFLLVGIGLVLFAPGEL